jgi:hypothetical protein
VPIAGNGKFNAQKPIAQRSSGVSMNSRETANLHHSNWMAGAAKLFAVEEEAGHHENSHA